MNLVSDDYYIRKITHRSYPRKSTYNGYKMSSRCNVKYDRVSILNLYDDVFLCIAEFLDQPDLCSMGQTCRRMKDIKTRSTHLKYYFIQHYNQSWHAQRQRNLKEIVIRNIKNIQFIFDTLPEYVYLGYFSSIENLNIYNGLEFISGSAIPKYPKVKKIFVDNASFQMSFYHFPNLEELFIVSDKNVNIDTLVNCQNLKKVVIYIKNQFVNIANSKIMRLPNLEIFAVHGSIEKGKFKTSSPNLKLCVVYSNCLNKSENTFYVKHPDKNPEKYFQDLFKYYNIIPSNITQNIKRMYF